MKITFYGAAQNITGSKHLIESNGYRLLLDCGLHQGKRAEAERLNRNFPLDAKSINAVILSHAHADHCGMLPVLVRNGFSGQIYCTTATADIAAYILKDSAALQEQDADYFKRHQIPTETPVEPLYTSADVEQTLKHFAPTPYFRLSGQWTELNSNIRFKLYDAGHILGSAIIFIEIKENGITKTLAFTGDMGMPAVPILHAPEYISEPVANLLMECTYGDKNHQPLGDASTALIKVITEAVTNKSKIIVPTFSLGRSQELIYVLHKLIDEKKIPKIPIYFDSPLAEDLTDVFTRHAEDFDKETWQDFGSRGEKPFVFDNLIYVQSVEQSKALNTKTGPLMIISASGMAEGGRIRHHLKNNISDPNNVVLITGYQAVETLGRKIQEGMSPVRIFNEWYDVRARIITLSEFSAHADKDTMLDYLAHCTGLKNLFLVHTEMPQAQAFKQAVNEKYPGLDVKIPGLGESFVV